jgi:hypothetical protein
MKNELKTLGTVVLLAVLAGAAFALYGYGQTLKDKKDDSDIETTTSTATSTLRTYQNDKYGFEFEYPANGIIDTRNAIVGIDPLIAHDVYIALPEVGEVLNIGVADNEATSQFGGWFANSSGMSVEEFARHIHDLNEADAITKSGKTVTNVESSSFKGQPSYRFTVTRSFTTPGGGFTLDHPTTFLFTERNNTMIALWYPQEEPESLLILNSFRFTR